MLPLSFYAGCKITAKLMFEEEAKMNVVQRCRKVGLKAEKHIVKSEDDYYLQLYRIFREEDEGKREDRPPVLMQHGYRDYGG
jgi:hypothetical protein